MTELNIPLHRRNFYTIPRREVLIDETGKVTSLRTMKPEPSPMITLEEALKGIVARDVQTILTKDAAYGSSWKKRGGVGAFMMLARKWDRLETQVTRPSLDSKYDIFDLIIQDCDIIRLIPKTDETPNNPVVNHENALDTIRDLRAYLLLVEAEMIQRKVLDNYGVGS